MAGISSLGIGSGLDLNSLVKSLLAAERAPVENSLNRQESTLTTRLTGVGLMKSSLSNFQSALAGLGDASSFSTRMASNSNTSALSATPSNDASTGRYSIDVNNLAASQSVASEAYASIDSNIGTGTIDIRFGTITGPGFTGFNVNAGTTTKSITVDASNNTLSGLRDEINQGDYGVTAAIVNDGSGYRLTFTGDNTGANNAMEISVTDTGDGNDTDALGLSALSYNLSATHLTQTQLAEDASISINGLAVTSSTNQLNEVIEGVNISLLEQTAPGSPLTLNITENNTEVSESITQVVEAYNEMMGSLNDLSKVDITGNNTGLLVGDAALRGFMSSVRSLMTRQVEGLDGSITALADVGITTQSNGLLKINTSVFDEVVGNNPEGAIALFAPLGDSADNFINFNSAATSTQAGSYAVNVTTLATQSLLNGASGVNSLTVDSNNDEFTLSIDGVSSSVIQLTHRVYASNNDLAAEIQSQINSDSALSSAQKTVTVKYDTVNDRFQIESDAYGSESLVEMLTVDVNTMADFGLQPATTAAGQDVAGSIGGYIATGSGQTLSLENGQGAGLSVDVTGGVIGDRGNIRFTRGLVEQLSTLMNAYLDSTDGVLAAKEDGLNASLSGISDDRESLDLRLTHVEARLISQFSALDSLIARFQTTGNFLEQQIDSLPGSGQLLK